jgi:integral membrane protein (TIGR01906 family)
MKAKEATGIVILTLVGLIAAFILVFILLAILPTHPGNDQHTEVMKFLIPGVNADLEFLNQDELDHMQDVKILIDVLLVIFVIGVFTLKKTGFKMRERFSGYGLLLVVAFFAGMSLKGFSGAWTNFHKIFFPQGGWYFPADSTIITMYPESYFFSAALLFTGFVIAIAGLLIQGVWYKQVFRK